MQALKILQTVFLLLCVCPMLQGLASQQVSTVQTTQPFNRHIPGEIELGDKGIIEIKLSTELGFPFIEVFINNQGPFKFLFDTGTDTSIISYELAKKLKLQSLETKRKVFEAAHQRAEIDTDLFLIEQLKMGEALFKKVPFIASNTASDDFQLLGDLNIHGILGSNLFHDVVITINFPQGKLVLSQHLVHQAKGQRLELDHRYYIPVIKTKVIRLKDETDYHFLVDSGYSGFIKMPICFPFHQNVNHPSIMTYDVFKQSESGFLSELDGTFVIGDKEIENPLVKYTLGNCENPPPWGLIGMGFLKYYALSIDQRNRIIQLEE